MLTWVLGFLGGAIGCALAEAIRYLSRPAYVRRIRKAGRTARRSKPRSGYNT